MQLADHVQPSIFTPSGAILAYSDPSTIKKLRITAAVAASTYTSYNDAAANGIIAAAQRSPPTPRNGARDTVETMTVELEKANVVVSLIKAKMLLAVIGPVDHPPVANGISAASDVVTSDASSPVLSNASSSSSSSEESAPAVQEPHHVPQISPLRILQLKSEGMTEFLREELRGFTMAEEA